MQPIFLLFFPIAATQNLINFFSRIFKYAPDSIISICRQQLSLIFFFLA